MKVPVVFVLGAGASIPYGYPSGAQLIHELKSAIPGDVREVIRPFLNNLPPIGVFQDALLRSSQPSIDTFLEYRNDMRQLGKLLLAASIMRLENETKLWENEDHWYPLLFKKLDGPFDELDFNATTIVTFNYDRSLEQFLFQAFRYSHNRSEKLVAEKLSQLRIIHVYGHVGQLDWQSADGRGYTPSFTAEDVQRAASEIKIISEGEETSDLREAQLAIQNAGRVFYLGMAYHDDNMRRLGFPWQIPNELMHGSVYDLKDAERELVNRKYGIHPGGNGDKCRSFLRNNVDFLEL